MICSQLHGILAVESEVYAMSAKRTLLVCVTAQESCDRLVQYGRRIARQEHATLRIVSVLPRRQSVCPDLQALERLNAVAIASGAQMRVCFSDDSVEKIREIALEESAQMLVVGFPGKDSSGFVHDLHAALPRTPLCMVDLDGTAYSITPQSGNRTTYDSCSSCVSLLLSDFVRSTSVSAP